MNRRLDHFKRAHSHIMTIKLLFDTYKDEALYVAGYFLRHAEKIQEILPEDGLDLIRKSVLTCAKVSDELIYKEIISKFGWDK